MRKIFDNMYWDRFLGQGKSGYSTVDEASAMLLVTLQIHEVMAEFYKHKRKIHPSITYIFVGFLVTDNISEPLQ